ncbi:MAG: alpha-glucan family phosphorylase [Bacteroidales bacterium]|jgi:phosphorylase/glycogen(starch) synthase|nr:alpha-glucan family phosphorylase [Bacteroidales bacterium]
MTTIKPDYLFEVSWDVCNNATSLYSVLADKAAFYAKIAKKAYIMIGPDVWHHKTNIEFIEDKELYKDWREQAQRDNLHLRVGRWNIEGNPITILVDFSSLISQKDQIFKTLWDSYQLDSISGGWDYIEPAVFGYATGLIIEHFFKYNVSNNDRVLAHYHQWTAGAGILYLEEHTPQVATVYSTYGTVIGREIANKGYDLYSGIQSFNVEQLVNTFNIRAKYSLEKTVAQYADIFTTVSDYNSIENEILIGKKSDSVLPFGISGSGIKILLPEEKSVVRNKIIKVVEAQLNQKIDDDALLLLHNARNPFRNKGTDAFIDALGKISTNKNVKKQIVSVIIVPADNLGVRQELLDRLNDTPDFGHPITSDYSTHYLKDENNNLIINRLRANNLNNDKEQNVKVVYIPTFVGNTDGVFNQIYSDFLQGLDATVLPVYYEPWGYSSMLSLYVKVPTLTTTLSGLGEWVKKQNKPNIALEIVDRWDNNYDYVVTTVSERIAHLRNLNVAERNNLAEEAHQYAKAYSWDKILDLYEEIYKLAVNKSDERNDNYTHVPLPFDFGAKIKKIKNQPDWKKVNIQPVIPEKLHKLQELSQNLWWSWDYEAIDLFQSIHPELWKTIERNPIILLKNLSTNELEALADDKIFMAKTDAVYARFDAYMKAKKKQHPKVAYFSMEFGLHESVKIYSGGLGILAGDYLKQASDSNFDMIGIGLLYRYGYFQQQISIQGEQIANMVAQHFSQLPIQPVKDAKGEWLKVAISFPGRIIRAKIWRLDVGRVPLYLLDTDIDENNEQDRKLTSQLYGGDIEHRLKQELLLGVGGVRAINKLRLESDIYHLNEGHAAFAGLERLRVMIEEEGKTYLHAKELARASSLFTTHTPVPAGHDVFPEDMMRVYIPHYPGRLGITWQALMGLGRVNEDDNNEKFSVSILAANLAQEMNGVSKIHGKVSRDMFANMFEGYTANELYIDYVTNGVHYSTWANKKWQILHKKYFGENFVEDISNQKYWQKIYNVPDKEIWDIRTELRKKLVDFAKIKLQEDMTRREENPGLATQVIESLDPNKLTIGFARRFATYKRAGLLFSNPQRLAEIVNHPKYPVQFVFAGKAHPADKAGQDLIKLILDNSRKPEFIGKIFFLENYDIDIAQHLVQGVDVWMNTPTRPQEASGTSGEKAIMNGVVNLSVLDGWWAEGWKEGAGWMLKEEKTYQTQELQNTLDAETIYNLIENEIAPLYYQKDEKTELPTAWIELIKNNFAEISYNYTMKRQLDDYTRKYYIPQYERSFKLLEKNARLAHQLAQWKVKVAQAWENITLVKANYTDSSTNAIKMGDSFVAEITLDIQDLRPEDIGVELVIVQKEKWNEKKEYTRILPLNFVRRESNFTTYRIGLATELSGVYNFAFRVFPSNPLLPHRQDFPLLKWV